MMLAGQPFLVTLPISHSQETITVIRRTCLYCAADNTVCAVEVNWILLYSGRPQAVASRHQLHYHHPHHHQHQQAAFPPLSSPSFSASQWHRVSLMPRSGTVRPCRLSSRISSLPLTWNKLASRFCCSSLADAPFLGALPPSRAKASAACASRTYGSVRAPGSAASNLSRASLAWPTSLQRHPDHNQIVHVILKRRQPETQFRRVCFGGSSSLVATPPRSTLTGASGWLEHSRKFKI